jgi:hemolysin III
MYLGMGWSALVCLPEVARTMPNEGIRLMVLGGVAYTAGVPFFVRNNSKFDRMCVPIGYTMTLGITRKLYRHNFLQQNTHPDYPCVFLDLDHAIWHLFVLAGSAFHWCGIYFYVAPYPLHHISN